MVKTQSIGICVILPSVPLIVDLRELESYREENSKAQSTYVHVCDDCVKGSGCGTLARSREEHLRLQPDHAIGVHHCCGCRVRQADEVLPLLLLHQIHDEDKSENTRLPVGDNLSLLDE